MDLALSKIRVSEQRFSLYLFSSQSWLRLHHLSLPGKTVNPLSLSREIIRDDA